MQPILLDTCAIIWTADPALAPAKARNAMREAFRANVPMYVSPITAWELSMLVSKGKMQMAEAPRAWFERLCNLEGLQLADLSIAVLINAGSLPDLAHGDPADRIIIATAREYGMRIVTRDRKILDYAEKGHVLALAC